MIRTSDIITCASQHFHKTIYGRKSSEILLQYLRIKSDTDTISFTSTNQKCWLSDEILKLAIFACFAVYFQYHNTFQIKPQKLNKFVWKFLSKTNVFKT